MKKKYFLLLFVLVNFLGTAQSISKKIDKIKYENRSLFVVLNHLNERFENSIVFDSTSIKNTTVNVDLKNITLFDAIQKIVAQNSLSIKTTISPNGKIIVSQKDDIKNNFKQEIEISDNNQYNGEPTRKNFTFSGYLKDKFSGETLPFATISVASKQSINTQSNVDGYFTLQNVPTDTTKLLISYIGYVNKIYQISPVLPVSKVLIELDAASQNLEEVTVKGEKTEMMKANEIVGMIKMTPRNIAKLPNIGEKDPFRAFQLMPGVSASNESSSGLYVRGGTPDQTLVLYDGFTVYNVDHLFGFFSAFNYNAIKDIQLFKGGFDARFGGRVSAVAEITSKEGNSKHFNAGADLSLLSTNAFIETPIGDKVTLLVAGRRSYKGPLYTKIFDKFKNTTNNQQQQQPQRGGGTTLITTSTTAASYFYDINSKLTFKPTEKDIISLSVFNGTDNMDNSTANSTTGNFGRGGQNQQNITLGQTTNDIAEWGNTGASLRWSRQWSQKLFSNSMVSFSDYFSQRDNSRNISITFPDSVQKRRLGRLEDNSLTDVTAKIDFAYKITPNHQVEFGGQYSLNNVKFKYTQNDTTKILDRNSNGVLLSTYLQDRYNSVDGKLNIIPGLRIVHFDQTKKVYFEPRLSMNYRITSKLKMKGAFGIYNQFVKQINREDISQGNRNFWILANDGTLPVTNSIHGILGGSYETDGYLFDVEFYQKNNTGISEYSLRFAPQRANGGGPGGPGGLLAIKETFFNGSEKIQGVDILVQKKFGDFNGWLGYTLAQAVRDISVFSLKPYYSDQDVRHQFKAVGSYKLKNLDLAATWIYSSGRPYTSIIGAYQLTLLDGTTKDFTNPSDKNANRFIDYSRMDVSATYNFKHGNIGLSVFNLYNRTNVWYKRFEVIKEAGISALQATDITYLGLTPNLTMSWRFR